MVVFYCKNNKIIITTFCKLNDNDYDNNSLLFKCQLKNNYDYNKNSLYTNKRIMVIIKVAIDNNNYKKKFHILYTRW